MCDLDSKVASPLVSYTSLTDPYLAPYFSKYKNRAHLTRMGLIKRNGDIVTENAFRLNIARKEHKRYAKDLIAQSIVQKTLDIERDRQIKIRRKLEEINKIELVKKMREERERKGDEDILPFLNPKYRPSTANKNKTLNRSSHSAPMGSSRKIATPILDEDGFIINDDEKYDTPRKMKRSKMKKLSRRKNEDNQLDQDEMTAYYKSLTQSIHAENGLTPYDIPPMIASEPQPLPRSRAYGKRMSTLCIENTDAKGKPTGKKKSEYEPHSLKGNLMIHRQEPAVKNQELVQTMAQIVLHYFGLPLKIDYENMDPRDEITIEQQHCGGNTLIVFKSKVLQHSDFSFTSRRHKGFPFSLTFYINGVQNCRLSVCCEQKHKKGARIGGLNGAFAFVKTQGSFPCYKCLVNKEIKNNEKKARKKKAEDKKQLEQKLKEEEEEEKRKAEAESSDDDAPITQEEIIDVRGLPDDVVSVKDEIMSKIDEEEDDKEEGKNTKDDFEEVKSIATAVSDHEDEASDHDNEASDHDNDYSYKEESEDESDIKGKSDSDDDSSSSNSSDESESSFKSSVLEKTDRKKEDHAANEDLPPSELEKTDHIEEKDVDKEDMESNISSNRNLSPRKLDEDKTHEVTLSALPESKDKFVEYVEQDKSENNEELDNFTKEDRSKENITRTDSRTDSKTPDIDEHKQKTIKVEEIRPSSRASLRSERSNKSSSSSSDSSSSRSSSRNSDKESEETLKGGEDLSTPKYNEQTLDRDSDATDLSPPPLIYETKTTDDDSDDTTLSSRKTASYLSQVGVNAGDKYEDSIHPLMENNSVVDLTNIDLSDKQVSELCDYIKKANSIEGLILRNCSIDDERLKNIWMALNYRSPGELKLLNLNCNSLTSDAMNHVKEIIKYHSGVETLLLHGNNIDDNGMASLVEGILESHMISSSDHFIGELDIGDCRITDDGIKHLNKLLSSSVPIKILALTGNKTITLKGWASLTNTLKFSKSLKSISLDYNNFGDDGCTLVADMLYDNKSLESIDLEGNNISNCDILIDALKNNSNISGINLGPGNDISHEVLQKIQTLMSVRN